MNTVKNFFQAIDELEFKPHVTFDDLIDKFTQWAEKDGFPEATCPSSLRKCESEIEEIRYSLIHSEPAEEILEEYVDALMCLLDSASRAGFGTKAIVHAFKLKLEKNMQRKWQKNDDNTYSHIKENNG